MYMSMYLEHKSDFNPILLFARGNSKLWGWIWFLKRGFKLKITIGRYTILGFDFSDLACSYARKKVITAPYFSQLTHTQVLSN